MWEAYELGNEDYLWTCIAFMGGIGGHQQAPCGAVSASAVCLGLRHRCSLGEKERVKHSRLAVRQNASELVKGFTDKFGTITCRDLLGVDLSRPDGYREFVESGIWKEKCDKYIEFVIEKLYEFDEKHSVAQTPYTK